MAVSPEELALETLVYALERGGLPFPEGDVLFVRAEHHPLLRKLSRSEESHWQCLQTWRPAVDRLERADWSCVTTWPEQADVVVFLPTKHKEEVLLSFARSYELLSPGGLFVASLTNSLGAKRFEKHAAALFGNVSSCSKHKCRAFWSVKEEQEAPSCWQEWMAFGEPVEVPGTPYQTPVGVFSRHEVDPGSALLLEVLSEGALVLEGEGADFGAGWGLLSAELLKASARITKLHALEAELLALDAAVTNANDPRLEAHWVDVSAGVALRGLDFVVMNPPFHTGAKTQASLGQSFVREAAAALAPNGHAVLVANRHLPYEQTLSEVFSQVRCLRETSHYKVLQGSHPR